MADRKVTWVKFYNHNTPYSFVCVCVGVGVRSTVMEMLIGRFIRVVVHCCPVLEVLHNIAPISHLWFGVYEVHSNGTNSLTTKVIQEKNDKHIERQIRGSFRPVLNEFQGKRCILNLPPGMLSCLLRPRWRRWLSFYLHQKDSMFSVDPEGAFFYLQTRRLGYSCKWRSGSRCAS